ncbi:MAG: endonuclease/exonuclease/phosphatase family protein [Chloroflexota bacterium]
MALRVCSWNLQLGLRLDTILEAVGELGSPDLVALQEASSTEGVEDAARVAERLGPDYEWWQVTAQRLRGRDQANAVVWNRRRVSLTERDAVALPTPAGRVLRTLRTRRNALMVEGEAAGRRLRFYSVHLDVLGIAHRRSQLAAVLEHDAARPPVDLTVIAGDLNTFGVNGRPAWAALHALAEVRGFEDVTARVGWTQARYGVRQKLDAVLARPAHLVRRAWALEVAGSDHIPVLAEIA